MAVCDIIIIYSYIISKCIIYPCIIYQCIIYPCIIYPCILHPGRIYPCAACRTSCRYANPLLSPSSLFAPHWCGCTVSATPPIMPIYICGRITKYILWILWDTTSVVSANLLSGSGCHFIPWGDTTGNKQVVLLRNTPNCSTVEQ